MISFSYYFINFRKETSSGIFWHNAAETWVDVLSNADNNVVEAIVNLVSGSAKKPQVDAHFMSESGVVDVFFLLGPEPMDIFRQFATLTGSANLPPVSNIQRDKFKYKQKPTIFLDYHIKIKKFYL